MKNSDCHSKVLVITKERNFYASLLLLFHFISISGAVALHFSSSPFRVSYAINTKIMITTTTDVITERFYGTLNYKCCQCYVETNTPTSIILKYLDPLFLAQYYNNNHNDINRRNLCRCVCKNVQMSFSQGEEDNLCQKETTPTFCLIKCMTMERNSKEKSSWKYVGHYNRYN